MILTPKIIREIRGMRSRREFASLMLVTEQSVYEWEKGRFKPGKHTRNKILLDQKAQRLASGYTITKNQVVELTRIISRMNRYTQGRGDDELDQAARILEDIISIKIK